MRIPGPITGDLEGDVSIAVLIIALVLLLRALDKKSPRAQRWGAFLMGVGVLSIAIALYVDAQQNALPYLNAPVDSEQAAIGQTIYNQYCMDCHGMDGRGITDPYGRIPPDLTTHIFQHDDAYLTFTIANGQGRMPGLKNLLIKSQIDAVIQYVRVMAKQELGAR